MSKYSITRDSIGTIMGPKGGKYYWEAKIDQGFTEELVPMIQIIILVLVF